MEDYQERVVNERDELGKKIMKLIAFMFTERFNSLEHEERTNLEKQLYIMIEYTSILQDRINLFKALNSL